MNDVHTLERLLAKRAKAKYREMFHRVSNGRASEGMTRWLCGCNYEFLILHIENQFEPGMKWKNRGLHWHVDHIKPCRLYDFTDERQVRACYHYRNLQPLWAWDNYAKGSK
jgi:hypothetical protein